MLKNSENRGQQIDFPDQDAALLFSNPFPEARNGQKVDTFEWAVERGAELACFVGDTFAVTCRAIANQFNRFER
jgi:hypothetical protein